ncbi:hypothetical protein JHK85_007864 [Glycine max]|nr:hypothetical protein JHK85_007864 [Glycine max]KAG5072423.1 hypothetical protein JHK86_007634 [Glycine max]KHN10720.1 Hypothetical protein glysoja_019151 [Glycine soja]
MEDSVSVRPSFTQGFHYFGVFDGHGCSHVATMCKEWLHEIVNEEIDRAREFGVKADDGERIRSHGRRDPPSSSSSPCWTNSSSPTTATPVPSSAKRHSHLSLLRSQGCFKLYRSYRCHALMATIGIAD